MTDQVQRLLEHCKNGDRHAQHLLYQQLSGRMFAVCLRYADTRTEAEDLLQEGFIKVFRDLHQYRGEGSFEGWARRVVVNGALQHLRKKRGGLQFDELASHDYHLADASDDPSVLADLSLWEGETASALLKLMQKLPPGFRTVLNLYVLEDYSHQQIADELGISVGTSKSQLNRAKAHLKALLEQSLTG
jgi:RNA polymerase sigma-70 factor (ECF subfamily)